MTSADRKPARPPLPVLDNFPLRSGDTIRFGDTDRIGHVNNAVFSTYLETGRAAFLLAPGNSVAPADTSFVLARLAIDYRAEILWPGRVDVGTRVASIGRTSVSLAQAVFQDGKCAATAESVLVLVDRARHKPMELPPASRDLLERYLR